MSSHRTTVTSFQSQYTDPCFERSGLFRLIQRKNHPKEVLYPGCSIHITPAFIFPHVVFVDKSQAAQEFFADNEAILDLIQRKKVYRRTPYIQFILQDYAKPLPLPEKQFDLVLSLFAGGISKACKRYLRKGGLLLTNNHQSDGLEAARDGELALIAIIQFQNGKYQLVDREPGDFQKICPQGQPPKYYLRQTSRGVAYIERESYYVFQRT